MNNIPLNIENDKKNYIKLENLMTQILQFFNVINNNIFRKKLNLPIENNVDRPLSLGDFITYYNQINPNKTINFVHINELVSILTSTGILIYAGRVNTSPPMCNCYYSMIVLSMQQRKNTLWYGKILGLNYIYKMLGKNVVHITGKTKDGDIHSGTGFLITNKAILTCKHVVEEMTIDKILLICGEEIGFSAIKTHDHKDTAIIILEHEVANKDLVFPAIYGAEVLDEVLVMGYPPIPCTTDSYLLSLKGEINSIVNDYINNTTNIILSSVTRPGNSGGPVLSKDGYLVGMVMQMTDNSEDTQFNSISKFASPFYMAFSGLELYNCIKEIDNDIEIFFEDYK